MARRHDRVSLAGAKASPNRNERKASRTTQYGSHLALKYKRITDLVADQKNPRRHPKRQLAQLATSIREFGFNVPVLIDRENNTIAGHGRLLAARQLGLSEVPTISIEHLTPEQVRAFQIADNRLGEISVWDEALLAESLKELAVVNLDFSLETTGFSMGEIAILIEKESLPPRKDPADAPVAVQGPVVTQLGDCGFSGATVFYVAAL